MPRRTLVVTLAILAATTGCSSLARHLVRQRPQFDADANFAAFVDGARVVLDRLPTGGTGVVEPAGLHPLAPQLVVEVAGERVAALRRTAPSAVEVVGGDGGVEPRWDDGAVRFTLRAVGGGTFATGRFARTVPTGGPPALSRVTRTVTDLRGTYEAAVRDAAGEDVGRLRLRIGPYGEAPRIVDGVLPPALSPAVATALVVALDGEIDFIASQATNVYRSDGTSGALEQSFPLGR
jgi:hypothetical protein